MASLAPAEKAPAGKPLKVGSPHDPAEREADRIADILTAPEEPAMPVCAACAAGGAPCAACGGGGGGVLRRQLAGAGEGGSGGEMVAPPSVHRVLSEPGAPLPAGIRGRFERRLGADLGGVRVHRGREADQAAASLGARAFTLGQRVVFGSGSDPLSSSSGMGLLGHELAHTQQVEASSTVRRDDMPDQPRAAGTRGGGVSSEAATPSTVVAAAVMEIAEALRQGDVSGVVAPLRSRGVGEIGDIRRAVHTQTEVWLEQWLVARQRLGESIDLALRLSTGAALLLPAGAVLGQAVSLVQQGSSNSRSRATAEEGIRLLWPALPLIERLEVYDEGFREIEQAQIEVIRSASAAQRTAATTAANSARLNRVLEHLNPKEEFDARVLLDPSWTYDAAERLLRRAPGIISDEEDAVFDALITLRPELRRRFFNQHSLALVRLFSVQRFRLVAALVRGSEAEALIIRLRLATEGRIDDQEAIQAVVDRAVALLMERRDLRSALVSTSLPATERGRSEARLRELDDLDRLLSFQRRQGGALAAGSFMGLLAEARGHHEPFGADLDQVAAFVPTEQARDFAFEAAKQRILLMAGDADAISAIIRGVHAPPVEVPADASPIQREGTQHRADLALRQNLLKDNAVREATRGFIGTERIRLEVALRADRFDAVVAQLNTAYNSARFGEFFRLVITIARRPDWRFRFQASRAELWGVYAWVQGTHRRLMERILASPERLPIDALLSYSGDVELLGTILAELDEPQRSRLRRGYVLSREAAPVGPRIREDVDAMDAYRRFEQQVLASQTTLGMAVDRAGIEAVLDAALAAEPTSDEFSSAAGRYRAAALLHHRINAREALRRGASAHFSETDETMLAAAREFQAHWLALGERRTLSTFEYAAFLTLYQRFESRSAGFTAASNAIGEMAGMVAATVAGVLVVAATGGAATPGVIALAAAAGGGSRVVTREMFGDDYYTALSDEGARDALLGGIDAALAVMGASLAARATESLGLGGRALAASAARTAGSVAEQASQSLSRRVLAGAVENAIDGVLSGSVSEAVGAMTDPRAWRRGIYQGLVRVGEAALMGGLMGLAGGAVIGAALPLADHGIRRGLDAVAARRIETSLAGAGLTSSLDAARAAARAGDAARVDRLWADLGAHLGPEDAQLLRRQLLADLEVALGHPRLTGAEPAPRPAEMLSLPAGRRSMAGTSGGERGPSITAEPLRPAATVAEAHDRAVAETLHSGMGVRPPPLPARAGAAPIAEGTVVARDIATLPEARRIFDESSARAPGREVAIWRNRRTGAYAVTVGNEGGVSSPAGAFGEWAGVQHIHPNRGNVLTYRNPAPRDVDNALVTASLDQRPHTEFIEHRLPNGGRTYTAYTAHPDGRITIEFERPDGTRHTQPFASLSDYQADWGSRTRGVSADPTNPEYRDLMRDIDEFYSGRRSGGASMSGTAPERSPTGGEAEGVIAGVGGRRGGVEPEPSFRGPTRVSSEPPFDYRVRRFNDISELPRNLDGTIAPLPEGVVYTFPDGTRVWRENDFTRHDTVVSRGVGRRETELEFLSAGEHGRPEVAGMERAHTLGQGTGFESPFGILMAPAEVNQIIQNNGIEELLRGFRDAARGGERFHLSTLTQAHWGISRLAEVRYRVSVSRGGGSPEFLFEYRITVGRDAPFRVEHGLANITESPDLSNYFDLVDVPARLRARFAMRARGGTAPIVHAENWASIEPLIDTPVATAVLPPGYTRFRGSAGSWVIRRRDPNDLRFQRLTVRPGPGGEPVIAVWRPFE